MAGLLKEVKVDGNYGSTKNFNLPKDLPKGALDNIPDDLKEAVATALKQGAEAEQAQKAGHANGNGVLVTTSQVLPFCPNDAGQGIPTTRYSPSLSSHLPVSLE